MTKAEAMDVQVGRWRGRALGLAALLGVGLASLPAQAQTPVFSAATPESPPAPATPTPASPAASAPEKPAGTAPLVPPAATAGSQAATLVGNTLVSRGGRGTPLTIYLQPDRTAKMLDDTEPLMARWSVHEDTLCLLLSREVGESCYDVEIKNSSVILTDENDKPRTFDLLPGNPHRL